MMGFHTESFPTLFKKLWGFISVVVFEGRRCLNPEEDVTIPDDLGSPGRLLRLLMTL